MKIILGTAQFGLPYGITNHEKKMPDDSALNSILNYAFKNGIDILDTAQAYGNANARIKNYHYKNSYTFRIINKILRHPLQDKKQQDILIEELQEEKRNLGIPHFECIMIHHALSIDEEIDNFFFEKIKKENISKKIGLSINRESDYHLVRKKINIDVVQAPYNILNQQTLNQGFIKKLKEDQCEIHVRSIFLQGLLLSGSELIPPHLKTLSPFIDAINTLSKNTGETPQTLCFSFALHDDRIDRIVLGVQSKQELMELFEAYTRATDLMNKPQSIKWEDYSCDESSYIDPTQWSLLEEDYLKKM